MQPQKRQPSRSDVGERCMVSVCALVRRVESIARSRGRDVVGVKSNSRVDKADLKNSPTHINGIHH